MLPVSPVKPNLRSRNCTCLRAMNTARADVVGAPEAGEDRLNRDDLAGGRRIDLPSTAGVDADVGDPVIGIGIRAREENQVARLQLVVADAAGRLVLLLRRTRQLHPDLAIDELHEPGAV